MVKNKATARLCHISWSGLSLSRFSSFSICFLGDTVDSSFCYPLYNKGVMLIHAYNGKQLALYNWTGKSSGEGEGQRNHRLVAWYMPAVTPEETVSAPYHRDHLSSPLFRGAAPSGGKSPQPTSLGGVVWTPRFGLTPPTAVYVCGQPGFDWPVCASLRETFGPQGPGARA